MLRGAAALIVVAEHVRAFLFLPLAALEEPNLIWIAFYAATSLGHQAVMIFFALSGFLVGGKALSDLWSGRWSWTKYALRRITRLWIVVLPAIVLTLLLDRAGMAYGYSEGYSGFSGGAYASLPADGVGVVHSIGVFIGNALFLQMVFVPVYGSNGPLWSLAYEFWYYVLMAVAMSLFAFWRSPAALAINLFLALLIAWMLPVAVLAGGMIWIAGAFAGAMTNTLSRFRLLRTWPAAVLGLIAIVAVMIVAELNVLEHSDLLLGITVAAVLPVLALTPAPWTPYQRITHGLSEVSYTLYVTHFPLLMAATMIFLAPDRLKPGGGTFALYCACIAGVLVWAVGFWACFERHTNRLYRDLAARLLSAASAGK